MGKTTSILRRSALALTVAIAMMAITGPASADELLSQWNILNGKANSEALNIRLTLPKEVAEAIPADVASTIAELNENETIKDAGIEVGGISKDGVIEQSVSLSNATVLRANDASEDKAEGFALPLQGLIKVAPITTKCVAPTCNASEDGASVKQSLGGTDPAGLGLDLGDLGSIEVAGAKSESPTMIETRNSTALAKVNLSLADLLGAAGEAGAGDVLDTLNGKLNEVVDAVNGVLASNEVTGAIATLRDKLDDEATGAEVLSLLDQFVTVGQIDDIPDLRDVDLLDLTVLGSSADVFPANRGSAPGLLARSASKVADINILGDWATIDAVGLSTESFANGVAGQASAQSDVQLAGVNLGGLLNVDVPEQALADLADPDTLKAKLTAAVADKPDEVQDAAGMLIGVIDMLYNIAGIDVELFKETTDVAANGLRAEADAGTLKLTVAPQTPVLPIADDPAETDPLAVAGAILSGDLEYEPTGLILEITLPNASSGVVLGDVLSNCVGKCGPTSFVLPGRTGVGTPLLVGVFLLGMAVVVRRFAMTK